MELATAQQLVWGWVSPKGKEWVSLAQCLGRVLAAPLVAHTSLPGECRSRMDGFALRSSDSRGASQQNPVSLKIVAGVGAAGHWTEVALQADECMRILTGAPLPPNADSVVAREDVVEQDGRMVLTRSVASGRWVAAPGDDVAGGDSVLPAGVLLTATRLALAAALGHAGLSVYRRPRVALLATGDEVLELGETSTGPWSYCNNRHLLALLAALQGGDLVHLGVAKDEPQAIAAQLAQADADLVITTGGIGQGDRDFVLRSWQELGVTVHIRQLGLSPGKNSAVGIRNGRIYAALPGNPWAAQVVFGEVLAPLLRRWQGLNLEEPTSVQAILTKGIENRSGCFKAVRGELHLRQEQFYFTPMRPGPGSLFKQLQCSTAYALIAANATELSTGSRVAVRLPDLPLLALVHSRCEWS